MSYGRPSKAERDQWAELLGDEGRKMRRIRVRVLAIVGLVAVIAGGFFLAGQVNSITGSCPDDAELRSFWAQEPGDAPVAERTTAIDDTINCVELTGKTREQLQAVLGDWTSVKEYKPTTKGGRASFLVWSNGERTAGVRVDFRTNGVARSAQEYRPSTKKSSGSGT
ncbi:MAG: hypothetical protein Q7T55_21160 [Solirubrobacteraceae bacterium]|nr:hypothetical protein [Solirubrobacteraceae bacterium]